MKQKELATLLKEIIGDEKRILTEKVDLYSYSYDASFGVYLPDIVVLVMSTTEVAAIMKLANKHGIPVYPRGQATSLSGGIARCTEELSSTYQNGMMYWK